MNKIALGVADLLDTGDITVQASHGDTEASRIKINLPVNATAGGLGLDLTTVSTASDAAGALDTIDSALDALNSYQARVGAYTNRLESAISLEMNAVEQTAAAQFRIEDLDMAFATANLARQQVLQQAGLAVMGQARSMQESAVRLIG
jgi:flagellin